MAGPARAGLFVYAKDLARVAGFYETLLGLVPVHATGELVILNSDDLQIIVHAMPGHVAGKVDISCPPALRDGAAYKFFYTVPSLADAEAAAPALGGRMLPEQWRGPGFVVRNAVDPEGNLFQLRERAS